MKLKRFLAFVVSLAMVLSIVPAFSLTASAAELTATVSKSIAYHTSGSAVVKKSGLDDNNDSRDLYVYHSGWNQRVGLVGFTMPEIPEGEYVTKATLRLYANAYKVYGRVSIGSVNNSWSESSYVEEEEIGIPTYAHSNTITTMPADFCILDEKNVNAINTWYEFDVTNYAQGFGSNEKISFVATHLTYNGETNGSEVCHLSFAGRTKGDLAPQLVIETAKALTVKYVDDANNEIVKTVTGYTADGYIATIGNNVVVDGDFYIVTGKSSSDGVAVINVKKKATASSNMFVNGDFEDGFNNWTTGKGAALSNSYFAKRANLLDASTAVFAYKSSGDMSTESSLQQIINITGGKDYFLSFNQMRVSGNRQFAWFQTFNSNIDTPVQIFADDTASKYMYTNASMSVWQTTFNADASATKFAFRMCWPTDSKPVYDNFELYEIEKIFAEIRIKYVDESGNALLITDTVITDKYVGDSYTTSLPASVTDSNGTTYVLASENQTLDWVSANAELNVITAVYKEDVIESAEDVTGITTREGVLPTLPETVTATLGSGNTMQASVTWNMPEASEFTVDASPVVVTGTVVEGVTVTATVEVVDKSTILVVDYGFEGDGTTRVNNEDYAADVGENVQYVDGVIGTAVKFTNTATKEDDNKGSGTSNPDDAVKLGGEVFKNEAFQTTKSATISMFVMPEGRQPFRNARLFDFGSAVDGNDLFFTPEIGDYVGNLYYQGGYGQVKPAWNTAVVDDWTHIAITMDYVSDSEWAVKIYKNGEVARTMTGSGADNGEAVGTFTKAFYDITGNYFLGISNWSDPLYNGRIDEFKIYADALTADEVADIGAKHTTTINYVYNDETVATEEVTGWNGQSVALLALVKDAEGNYYIPAAATYTVDKEETTANVDVTLDETKVDVTATYVLPDGEVVKTETKMSENGAGVVFDELWVANDGENYNYYTAGAPLTADGEIKLEAKANKAHYAVDETITTTNGETYKVLSGNLVPNGDFSDDFAGWLNGSSGTVLKFTLNKDAGNITSTEHQGNAGESSLYRSWAIEPGATYVFRGYHSNMNSYQVLSFSNELGTDEAENIVGDGDKKGSIHGNFIPGETSSFAFTNTDNYKYVKIRYRWNLENTFGDFGLYKVEPIYTDYTLVVEGTASNDGSTTVQAFKAAEIEIPAFDGYVLKNRVVDEANKIVTLTYAANVDLEGTWAQRNYIAGTKPFNEMKFLGSHNSFTDKMRGYEEYIDEAGVYYGDSGAEAAQIAVAAAGLVGAEATNTVNQSKNQSADALTQLNAGVRFFDIRLSRHSDGTYYTRHGLISEDFKTVATTIAQYAEENPGEVIVLDFQSMFDALYNNEEHGVVTDDNDRFGKTAGDDNLYAYQGLWKLLEETGLAEYIVGDISLDTSYNDLTDNGTKTAVVAFAKNRGAKCIDKFVDRNTIDADTYVEDGNYDTVKASIETNYGLANGKSYNVIHAYATGSNLISDANTNNPKFYKEANFATWMANANVLLLDNVVSDAGTYIELFKEYNRDGYTVTVDGEKTFVKLGEAFEYRLAEGGYALVDAANKIYTAEENGVVTIAAENVVGGMMLTSTGFGLDMVSGAQVRIGDGVDANGKVDANSGIRFITLVDKSTTLAAMDGATFGVRITAEDSEEHVDIATADDKWQNDTTFTSALTNLAVNNYNRKFTATPYVEINGTKYFGTPVTRSIYQVAAGLLVNNMVDEDNTNYGEGALEAKSMIDVLNAYVNQTGIRLTLSDNTEAGKLTARTAGSGAYTGEAFFEVGDTTVDGNVYTVTLTPVGGAKINMSYWNEYVRINNNNYQVKVATTLTENTDEDGNVTSYTLTFNYDDLGSPKTEQPTE